MTAQKFNGKPVTVLLVEDNASHAELVIRSFEDHRIANRIHHVFDGEEALDYLLRRGDYADPAKSPMPHMVLLDLRLPRIDGLEVLKEIKSVKELEKIPTVIFTTSSAEMDVAKAYEYHANSYLVKPVNFEMFNQLMDDIGFYWLAWNHHPWGD